MAKPKQTAVAKDILINQGADYRLQFRLCTGTASNYTPIDITGYTFECKIAECHVSIAIIYIQRQG